MPPRWRFARPAVSIPQSYSRASDSDCKDFLGGATHFCIRLMTLILTIKGDKVKSQHHPPAYVPDVSKVQIWCAFAEVVLGEASFPQPVQVSSR
jgi:hypothetical protein